MANSLFMRAPGAIGTPIPGAPIIASTGYDYHFKLAAEDHKAANDNGAVVSRLVAPGAASAAVRTFATKHSVWNFPKMKYAATPTGKAALLFEGSEHLANALAALPGTLASYTYAIVLKVADWTGGAGNYDRIIGGDGANVTTMRLSATVGERLLFSFGGGAFERLLALGNGYFVVLLAVDGTSTSDRLKIGDGAVETVNLGNNTFSTLSMGCQSSSPGSGGLGQGFKGEIANVQLWPWAMSAAELNQIYASLKAEYIGA
ncbi:hypothetical protein GRI97_15805 [Altererythrobacter xixiisoli]|uniref:LamG domain-containing protein n=1 Tax=Croceibacterium xixiisoli TaxID=1476466 RepID=A0A6I4TW96_9SPHN|nr:hypothetical protein [Croceibacterium xixiisoli]MXP00456.1 hypothetical protein [Croceibacterium xixiisoli]